MEQFVGLALGLVVVGIAACLLGGEQLTIAGRGSRDLDCWAVLRGLLEPRQTLRRKTPRRMSRQQAAHQAFSLCLPCRHPIEQFGRVPVVAGIVRGLRTKGLLLSPRPAVTA